MFPSGPTPFVHPNHLEEALSLTLRYNITSVSLLPYQPDGLLVGGETDSWLADPKRHLL